MRLDQWNEAIIAAMKRFRKPSKRDVLPVARTLFSDEIRVADQVAAEKGHLAAIANAMRQLGNLEESPDGTFVQLDLPGMAAPAYLAVPDPDGGYTIVNFAKAVPHEIDAAIAEREKVVGRISARVTDLRMKREHLSEFFNNDMTTVEQAIANRDARIKRTDVA